MTSIFHGLDVNVTETSTLQKKIAEQAVNVLVGTAPDADPDVFPYGKNVLCTASDGKLSKLGKLGTLPQSVNDVMDQGIDPLISILRVKSNINWDDGRLFSEVLTPKVKKESIIIRRSTDSNADVIPNRHLIDILSCHDPDDNIYQEGVDWDLVDDKITWQYRKGVINVTINNRNAIDLNDLIADFENSQEDTLTNLAYQLDKTQELKLQKYTTQINRNYIVSVDKFILLKNKTELPVTLEDGLIKMPSNEVTLRDRAQISFTYCKTPPSGTQYNLDVVSLKTNTETLYITQKDENILPINAQGDVVKINSVSSGSNIYTKYSRNQNDIIWDAEEKQVELIANGETSLEVSLAENEEIQEINILDRGILLNSNDFTIQEGFIIWTNEINRPLKDEKLSVRILVNHRPPIGSILVVSAEVETTILSSFDDCLGDEGVGNLINLRNDIKVDYLIALICAPGLSYFLPIGKKLEAIAHQIDGYAIIDQPWGQDYQEIMSIGTLYSSSRTVLLAAWREVWNKTAKLNDHFPWSPSFAGMYSREMEDELNVSPSNKQILGVTGTNYPIPHNHKPNDLIQLLNKANITGLVLDTYKHMIITDGVSKGSFIAYGNRASNGVFISITTALIYVVKLLEQTVGSAIDLMNKPEFFTVVNALLSNAASYAMSKNIIYYPNNVDPFILEKKKNPLAQMLAGNIRFTMRFGLYIPQEVIGIDLEIHSEYLLDLYEQSPIKYT